MAQSDYLEFRKLARRWGSLAEYPRVLGEADYLGLKRFATMTSVPAPAADLNQLPSDDLLTNAGATTQKPLVDAASGLLIQYGGGGQVLLLDLKLGERCLVNSVADLSRGASVVTSPATGQTRAAFPLCGGAGSVVSCRLSGATAAASALPAAPRPPAVTPRPSFVKDPGPRRNASHPPCVCATSSAVTPKNAKAHAAAYLNLARLKNPACCH